MAVSDTHEAWVDRCARWERLYKAAKVDLDTADDDINAYVGEIVDLRAVVVGRDTQIAALKAALAAINAFVRTVDISDRDMVLDRFAEIGALSHPAAAVGIPEERP